MKTIHIAILLLLSPLTFFAQSLTGLWMGTVSNDSTTIRKDQSFEIVLTQYKDKVYGYSRSTFIVNDTLYYIVKRVRGTIENDVCEVKDDDIISHNFPRKPDKGVKLVSTFRRNQSDSIWRLDGDWKTTESKKHRYYSISGKINLQTEKDLDKSKIFPHLEELKLADDVAFYKESKKEPEPMVTITPRDNKTAPLATDVSTIADLKQGKKAGVASVQVNSEPHINIQQPIKDNNPQQNIKQEKPAIASTQEIKKEEVATVAAKSTPDATNKQTSNVTRKEAPLKEEKSPTIAVREDKKESLILNPAKSASVATIKQPAIAAPIEKKKEEKAVPVKLEPQKTEPVAIIKTVDQQKNAPTKENNPPLKTISEVKPGILQGAALIAERKVAAAQTVFFKSDSLELSLYDNGEIDGDTVSLILNGQVILAKQGLKASAIKKTIYITASMNDSLTLVLYAENLGKYPPNTGLLVVHDGEDVYQVRFSADLQQNAAVIFRRKRN